MQSLAPQIGSAGSQNVGLVSSQEGSLASSQIPSQEGSQASSQHGFPARPGNGSAPVSPGWAGTPVGASAWPHAVSGTAGDSAGSVSGGSAPAVGTSRLGVVDVPALGRGVETTEFLLSLGVLGAILAALWAGKIDAGLASALLGLVATAYPGLRTWLKAQHLDKVAEVLAAQQGAHAEVYHAAAAALAAVDATEDLAAGSAVTGVSATSSTVAGPAVAGSVAGDDGAAAGVGAAAAGAGANPVQRRAAGTAASTPAVLAALALGFFAAGCANAPYYVSGVDASVTTGPNGQGVTGGAVGVSFAPNPAVASAPVNPAPVKSGTAGVKASTITIPIPIALPTPAPVATGAQSTPGAAQ